MSADPRFLDSWLAARPPPKVSGSLQVRLDAPSGITHAPDQTDPHTASRRLFAVPKLPEPPELLYDFEDEIIGYERAVRREPTFVLGDDDPDGMTPAQMLAAEYRDKDTGGQDVQPDKNPVAEDHASAQQQTTASAEPEASSPSKADEPEALVDRVSDMHLAPGNADEPPTDTDDVEPRGFAFSTDDADEDITKNVWESVFTSRQSSAAPPSVSDKASEAKGAAPAAEHAAPVTDDVDAQSQGTSASHEPVFTEAREDQEAEDAKESKEPTESEEPKKPKESEESKEPEEPKDAGEEDAAKASEEPEASTEAKGAVDESEETTEKPSKAAKKKAKKQAKKAAKKAQEGGEDAEPEQAAADAKGEVGEHAAESEAKEPEAKEPEAEEPEEAKPEAKAEPKAKADSEPKAESEAADDSEPKAEIQPKAETEPKAEAENGSAAEAPKETPTGDAPPETPAERVSEAGADDTKTVTFADGVSEHTVDTWAMPPKRHIPIADTASIRTAQSHAASLAPSTAPTISQMTLLSNMKHDRPKAMPKPVRTNFREYKYQPPPSQSDPKFGTHVWDAPKYNTLRSTETLVQQPIGMDAGSQWERVSGYGQARPAAHDSAAQTSIETVRALFVPDPRTWHPYRFVRRTDPRQVLIFAAGTSLSGAQVKAAQAAKQAAIENAGKVSVEKLRSLASHFGTTENTNVQGGIGVVYSPTASLCAALDEPFDAARAEKNVSRRLERPEFPNRTTTQRAALRSVIAALEYMQWEKEGFDKVVIAVHNAWIVRGISHDIWTWRQNGWVLTRETPQGLPGESVPNRDLWELLDHLVRQWEDVEYVAQLTQRQLSVLAPAQGGQRRGRAPSGAGCGTSFASNPAQSEPDAHARPLDEAHAIVFSRPPPAFLSTDHGFQVAGRCRECVRSAERRRDHLAAVPGTEPRLVPSRLAAVHRRRSDRCGASHAGPRAADAKHDARRGRGCARAHAPSRPKGW